VSREKALRAAAAALVRTGMSPDGINLLRDLVQPVARVRTILEFHLRRKQGARTHMTWRVAEALRLLARDYCQVSKEDVDKISIWAKNIKMPKQTRMTSKNEKRVRALLEPRAKAMLLHLPRELMRRAQDAAKPEAAARLAMYAVALEILLVCPMRRKNLVELSITRNLHRPDPSKGRISHLKLAPDEVKNEEPLHWPVPPESARLIETYINRYRPVLASGDNDFLFPGRGNGPRAIQQLADWLSKTVTREVGAEFNVHLARHFAAASYLARYPGQYEMVRRLLGHKNIQTTISAYVSFAVDAAAQRFDAIVLQDRQALRSAAAEGFRRAPRRRPQSPKPHAKERRHG
jgi:integrase